MGSTGRIEYKFDNFETKEMIWLGLAAYFWDTFLTHLKHLQNLYPDHTEYTKLGHELKWIAEEQE